LKKMFEAELFVRLIIPDSTAITAFHTLERMGYTHLKKLKRESYYKFYAEGDYNKFKGEIGKVDILVNYNKDRFIVKKPEEKFEDDNEFRNVKVLVKNTGDDAADLLSTLKERLGFNNIKKIERGILWTLSFEKQEKAEETAKQITEKLLANRHYQDFEILN